MNHFIKYEHQEEKPWVTFIHGAGGSSSIWFAQIREFKKNFNVLLIDLRGHGKSKQSNNDKISRYTFKLIGDEVIDVLNHLKIDKTHFVGISMGTIIMREITERYPERTLSMIMGGAVMKLNVRGQFLMQVGVLLKSVLPYLVLYRFFAYVIMPKKNHRDSRNLFINEAKKLCQKEFKRWFTLVAQVNPILSLFRIKDSGIPTIYIMGEDDYMFLPSITKLVANHKSSQLCVIPNCGHVVNVEQPSVFNSKSIEFINHIN